MPSERAIICWPTCAPLKHAWLTIGITDDPPLEVEQAPEQPERADGDRDVQPLVEVQRPEEERVAAERRGLTKSDAD